MTTTQTYVWRDLVQKADPDYEKERMRPYVYEFANDRKFYERIPIYGTAT